MEQSYVDLSVLASRLRAKRAATGKRLKDVSKLTGVSPTSLSRFERWKPGELGFNLGTISAVAQWVGDTQPASHRASEAPASLPDYVCGQLQTDRHLDRQSAATLGEVFRQLYELISKKV